MLALFMIQPDIEAFFFFKCFYLLLFFVER